MSTRNQREQAKRETRTALIVAAMSAFAEEGLDAPSLDAICERAGYTRGAFYVHFRDREELIAAVMEQFTTAYVDALLGSGESLAGVIKTFAQAADLGAFPPPGTVASHQLLQACARSDVVRDRYRASLEDVIRRLAGTAQRTGSDAPAPRHVALLLVATVLGAQTLLEVGVEFRASDVAESLLRLLDPEPGQTSS